MDAFLVTFYSDIGGPQLIDGMRMGLERLQSVPGLVMKTYLFSGENELGSLYMFCDRAAADAYLAGEAFRNFIERPFFSNVEIQRFGVLDELSAPLGTPMQDLSGNACPDTSMQ